MKDARAKNSRTRHKIIALQIGSSAALSLNGIALCDCNFWVFFFYAYVRIVLRKQAVFVGCLLADAGKQKHSNELLFKSFLERKGKKGKEKNL